MFVHVLFFGGVCAFDLMCLMMRRFCFVSFVCLFVCFLFFLCHVKVFFNERQSKKSRSKWVFGKCLANIQFFLYFCTGNQISWLWRRMSLWRHRSQRLGMLVLYLVSMFRGDSKLIIGTKIGIIRWFRLIIWGWGSCVTKLALSDEG